MQNNKKVVCLYIGAYESHGPAQMTQVVLVSGWSRVREYLSTAMLVGGVAYGLYYFYKVRPKLRNFYSIAHKL